MVGRSGDLASAEAIKASVIVSCREDAHVLGRALDGLCAQDAPFTFEVIVVDSGRDQAGGTLAKDRLEGRLPLTVIGSEAGLWPGAARNRGAASAKGDIVAFLEADCVPRPDWLARRARWHDSGFQAVAGAVGCARPYTLASLVQWTTRFCGAIFRRRISVRRVPFFGWSYSREVLDRPFREDLPGSEDREFNQRLKERGARVVFDPSIVIDHIGLPSFRAVLRHQHHHGRAAALMGRAPEMASAVARFEKPGLVFWYPPLKWVRMLPDAAAGGISALALFVALMPWQLAAHAAWARGFAQETNARTQDPRLSASQGSPWDGRGPSGEPS